MDDAHRPEHKFAADINLGRLVRWLRILGYDTRFDREGVDRGFLRRAQCEERIVLTRKRNTVNRQFRGRLVLIEHDQVGGQLKELHEKLGLSLRRDSFYSRCVRCNALLAEAHRCEVEGLVPDYVYHQSGPFRRCISCDKVYWPGAHREMAFAFLRKHTPLHLP